MRVRRILLFAMSALLVLLLVVVLSSKASAEDTKTVSADDLNADVTDTNTDTNIYDNNITDVTTDVTDVTDHDNIYNVDGLQSSDRLNNIKPDLTIKNVVFVKNPGEGETVIFHVSIKNTGTIPARNVKTALYIDNEEINTENVASVRRNSDKELTFSWKATPGEHELMVVADPYDEIDEINENNNMYTATIILNDVGINMIGSEPPPPFISRDMGAAVAAFGAFSILAMLGLYSDKYRFFTLFAPLYTRIKKKHVLDHFTRGRIYGFIESNPGAHYNMIRDALGLNNGSLAYHLRMLEKTEYVTSKKAGKCRYFYPSSMNISKKNGLSNLQNSILEKIVETPEITQKEIADETGVSQQVVSYNVKKMIKNGVLKIRRNGRESYLYVAKSFGA